MEKIIFFLSLAGAFIFFSYAECLAFRCGDGFVSTGDIKTKVIVECGQPTFKEKVGVKKETGISTLTRKMDAPKNKRHKKGKKKDASLCAQCEETSNKRIEKWYYNCGDNDFIYILTFAGDTLIKEETGGYGKGISNCGGNDR